MKKLTLLLLLVNLGVKAQTYIKPAGSIVYDRKTGSRLYFKCLKTDLLGNCEQFEATLSLKNCGILPHGTSTYYKTEILHSSLYKALYQNKEVVSKWYQRRMLKRLFEGETIKYHKLNHKRFYKLVTLIRNVE